MIDKSSIALQKEKNGQIINCIQHNKKKDNEDKCHAGKKTEPYGINAREGGAALGG